MANRTKRAFSVEEKVRVLRLHLIEKVPVSDICDQYNLAPNLFYRWKKEFFENGAAAFDTKVDTESKKLSAKVEILEKKLAHKDGVIAQICEDTREAKKTLGES
ncbi:MAG: transposase [Planctomycetes bacterium]|nr:transposase [Planctomycetota bacterium]